MNHTALGIGLIVLLGLAVSLAMSTFVLKIIMFNAFAKNSDGRLSTQNNQEIFVTGKHNMAANIATNVICASPGPCIIE